MSFVIDVNGNPKKVAAGYILQPGETHRSALLMQDGAPSVPSARRFMVQDGHTAQLGDAVAIDMCGDLERLRFGDGTMALQRPDGGFIYVGRNGQQGSMSLDQCAHSARVRGEATSDPERDAARREAAYDHMVDGLSKASRPGGPSVFMDTVTARDAMVADLSNAWQAR